MIELFRKIRQNLLTENKFSKYLLYAAGEIILVVIGILIALQINNWNESRKRKLKETYFLNSFYDENKANLEKIDFVINYSESFLKDVDTLLQILRKDDYSDKRIKELIPSLFSYPGFLPNTLTLENMQSSYQLDLIEDLKLREMILKTYGSFRLCVLSEKSVGDYSTSMIRPFVLNNVDFRPSVQIEFNNKEKIAFVNNVSGYHIAWNEQLKVYKDAKEEIKLLDKYLTAAIAN